MRRSFPELSRPVSRRRLEGELRTLMRVGGINDRDATIGYPASLDVEHAVDPRRYAQVYPDLLHFEFARATRYLPAPWRIGVLAHEVGHVLDPTGTEEGADLAAFEHLGVRIGYDRRWPGKGLQVAVDFL